MFKIREAQVEALTAAHLQVRQPWAGFVAEHPELRVDLDSLGLPRRLTTPARRTFEFMHDRRGRLNTIRVPERDALRFEYDNHGKITGIYQGNARYSFEHNKRGQITGITYPDHRKYSFEYLPRGVIHKFVDRAGGVRQFRYGQAGSLESIEDPLQKKTSFTGKPAATVKFPDGSSEQLQSGPGVFSRLLRDGTSIHVTPGLESPLEISWPDGETTRFSYCAKGQIAEATHGGEAVRFEYDENGNTSSETTAEGKAECAFDGDGRLLALQSPRGRRVEYRYDADGVIESIDAWGECAIRLVTAADGQIKEIHFGKELIERRQFGASGPAEETQITGPGGTVISRQSYRYDVCERLISFRDAAIRNNAPREFAYDPEDRLLEDRNGTSSQSFRYDKAGNLLRAASREIEQRFETGPLDASVRCGSRRIEYDRLGRMTRFPGDKGEQRLEYDGRGLLNRCSRGPKTILFDYDALGRRIRKNDGAGVWKYVWFGQQLLWEEYQRAGAQPVRRDYLFVPGTFAPLAFRENGRLYFVQTDVRGAVTRVIDSSGQIVWHAEYSSFGSVSVRTGKVRQPFRLLGHYEDEETGLQYTLARYYSPELACYLGRDPRWAESFATNYSYARNDPWNRADPSGGFPSLILPGLARSVGSVVQSVSDAASYVASGNPVAEVVAVGLVTTAIAAAPAVIAVGALVATGSLVAGIDGFFASLAGQLLSGEPVSIACASADAGAASAAFAAAVGTIALAGVNQLGRVFGFGAASSEPPPRPPLTASELDHTNEMALLSNAVYNEYGAPPGFTRLSDDPGHLPPILQGYQFNGGPGGLHAAIFQKDSDGSVVVAYRGTVDGDDTIADVKQAMGLPSEQYSEAAHLARQVKAAYPGQNIELTGHSLGGGLAHMGAAASGFPATTFNAAGLSDYTLARYGGQPTPLVTNYVIQGEMLSTAQSKSLLPIPDSTGNNIVIAPRNTDGSIPPAGPMGADWHKMATVLPSLDYARQNAHASQNDSGSQIELP